MHRDKTTNETNAAHFFFFSSFPELFFELLLSCLQVFLAVLSKQCCVERREKKNAKFGRMLHSVLCCGAIYGSEWKSGSQQGRCVEGSVCVAQGFPFVYPEQQRIVVQFVST